MTEKPFVPAAGRDWLLPLYDPLTKLLGVERYHRRLLEQAGIRPGSRVLDVGCGTGSLTILAKRLNPAAELIGIDPDPKALARARRKAQRAGLKVHFDSAYSERLPFPDACFDTVLSALMLHHIHRDTKLLALREIRRVLKPGGSLHLADFDKAGQPRGLHGVLASMLHSRPGSTRQGTVLGLMRDAGLGDAEEIARRASVMGRIVYYSAARTPAPIAA
ncbi:MAG TPA: class I SAM-dependent methyltransferase [Gemmatimonadales bacterium]|nr:class I SAM-dependent methyltransferase [Gemmatimonadales bacterium]